MTTNNTTTTATRFHGYDATMTNKSGETYPCRVINARENMSFIDGTFGSALKIAEIFLYTAGNNFNQKTARRLGSPMWVKAERVKS